MKFISFCNAIIRWSFYTLFLFVPLVFAGDTSELFEFNKMWLTFILTLIIAAAWVTKMILQRRIYVQRTPLDIPIVLFLLSQIISTIFSIDHHVSLWGYYSRFNGGLLSIISYIFLYYALVSNTEGKKFIFRLLSVSLFSGLIVALWGLPSHFGYDPTCLLFRGTFDVSCWTAAFQPKVRIFSTLGQPDWLAAYLTILIPIAIGFGINALRKKKIIWGISYFLLSALFYVDFLYTRSKGSSIAIAIAAIFAIGLYFLSKKFDKKKIIYVLIGCVVTLLLTFFAGTAFTQLDRFTFGNIVQKLTTKPTVAKASQTQAPSTVAVGELGGTDSGKIRLFVWQGALQIWEHNLLFGSGVETFAYAYYKYRPAGHNLTSEWDYLYNKAHNEYLNYLATTGAFGLLSYLAIIGLFLWQSIRFILKTPHAVQDLAKKDKKILKLAQEDKRNSDGIQILLIAILAGYLTILISNFFGFSVVIVNEYFFIIPAFVYILAGQIQSKNEKTQPEGSAIQYVGCIVAWIICFYCISVLVNYWFADRNYGLGMNLDKVQEYQQAYAPLHQALAARTDEPVFKDEAAINDAVLAAALFNQKDSTDGAKLAQEAIQLSGDNVTNYPNNVVFWKTRTRVMYTLSQVNPQYLPYALQAILTAQRLAPTDAKISYNVGLMYAQTNNLDKAISTLQETIKLKSDYRDAYYALGLLLHEQAVDKNGKVINPDKQAQAVATLTFILQKLSPDDVPTKQALASWTK